MKLKTLSIITGILFVISLVVYNIENRRGTDLVNGSDYIKGLDVGKIQKITLSFKEGKKLTFSKDGGHFLIENHKLYPASTDKINDLIYKIASIQVKEKVTSNPSESDLKDYELGDKRRKYLVEIFDNDGNKTVAFSVGKSPKGKGNYLYRESSKDVYLSQNSVWINSSPKDFINTLLLDVKRDDINRVQLVGSSLIELAKRGNDFVLEQPPKKNFKKDKVKDYFGNFSNLRFDEFYKHNDGEVKDLKFKNDVKLKLKSKLIYKISLAKNRDDHFVKVTALTNEIPQKIEVSQSDGKEKISGIEGMIKAQGVAQKFNLEKGSWAYKISQLTYEKLVKKTKDFL